MILPRLALAVLLSLASPAVAETAATGSAADVSTADLGEVLQLDALFAVLRDEGIQHGGDLAKDMLPDGGGAGWTGELQRIYDLPALRSRFDAVLTAQLASDPEALRGIMTFYGSDLGKRILGLEIDARRAFLDTAAEEAARVAADDAAGARDPKVALIRRMIEAGDLLEMNVAGSLTSNLAFVSGMAESGAYGTKPPAEQLSSDTWGQEDQTRSDMSTWLYAYLGLAYAPLTEAELESYVEFWESRAGQRLNAALFTAFDQVFRQVSHDLGRAAGTAMQGRDI
jgi:hypothetical protein